MPADSSKPLSGAMMIPDLLRTVPQARSVLDRYGLKGCGGPLGPHESLEFFARAHDVPVDQLLSELRIASHNPLPFNAKPDSRPERWSADEIYRPFFLAGIAVILTLGAVWGAYLLLRIALTGRFSAVGLHEVNAHGHAQIFGWVGLFVMGFAYQAFPRFKHTSLRFPGLAFLSFALMLGGLVIRSVLEPVAGGSSLLAGLAVTASAVEVIAIGLFVWVIVATWRASGKGFAFYDGYILSALFWFLAQAIYEAVYLFATFQASPETLVPLVATWQGALRDLQIHGFATLMILGVSQRLLPHMYGFPHPSRRLSLVCLVGLNLAVAGEATGLVLMRLHSGAWATLWYSSVLLFSGCAVALIWNWKLFGAAGEPDRTRKFVRAAYVWFLIAQAMLVVLPAYQFAILPAINSTAEAVTMGFSHAYYGAARHAITVGFISLMIVGVAAKVVPVLRGADARTLSQLWIPFVLINLGCTLRVVGQTATDWAGWVFPITGISGILEVTGLAFWGAHLCALMLRRPGWAEEPRESGPRTVVPEDYVSDVIRRQPELLPVFLDFGFHPLANAMLRRTVARGVTIRLACQFAGVDLDNVIAALNARVPATARTFSLPVLRGNEHMTEAGEGVRPGSTAGPTS